MSARILVVEDDEDMLDTVVETLESEGYDVVACASGREALSRAAGTPLDLVITDVRMAGLDGIDTLAALRKQQPALRSIIITGYASDDAPSRAIREQAWDYLYKPFGRKDLLLAVKRVLDAEEEHGHLQRMLDAVTGGARQLLEAANAAIVRAQLAAVDKVRDAAFRSCYVGVRSRKLGLGPAYAAWVRLEELERDRERLKKGTLSAHERQALEHGYRYITDMLSANTPDAAFPPPSARDGQVDRATFKELHARMCDGRVSSQQLTLAPFLRALDPIVLRQSPDLSALYASIWGEPSLA